MTPEPHVPTPYRVVYSGRVRERLRALAFVARDRGDGDEYKKALAEFDRLLRLYPQFGEPLIDLKQESGQLWIGTVRPLTLRYTLFDELRVVIASAPPVLLPTSRGNDAE